jgi:hypothetical protein
MTRKSKRLLPALEHIAIFLVLSCSLSEGNTTLLSQKMHENDDVERAQHSIEGKKKYKACTDAITPLLTAYSMLGLQFACQSWNFSLIAMTIWSVRVSYSSGILHESSRI